LIRLALIATTDIQNNVRKMAEEEIHEDELDEDEHMIAAKYQPLCKSQGKSTSLPENPDESDMEVDGLNSLENSKTSGKNPDLREDNEGKGCSGDEEEGKDEGNGECNEADAGKEVQDLFMDNGVRLLCFT
jgi:hypothetical protein